MRYATLKLILIKAKKTAYLFIIFNSLSIYKTLHMHVGKSLNPKKYMHKYCIARHLHIGWSEMQNLTTSFVLEHLDI